MGLGGVVEPNADITALKAAIDGCHDAPILTYSPAELSCRLAELVRLTAKLDALRVETVRVAEAAVVGQLTDQRNTANHAASVTNVDPGVVRADLRLATWLADLPILADAYQQGLIHTEHLELLRLADNVRVHWQLVADQKKFVDWFTTCHFRDLKILLGDWLLGADPDGAEPKEQQKRVGLTITPLPGGMAEFSGIADPLQAAALRTALNSEAQAIRRRHQETGVTSTHRRRMLDALLNLISRGSARPDGTHPRPLVNVVMSQRVYDKTMAWLQDPRSNPLPDIDPYDIDKKCQLIDGTVIHPLHAIAATATATFRRLVYGARGRPPNVSYETRRIPDWMRDATLVTTNGMCANPVCDAPFEWLHADHVIPYSHTRTTKLEHTRPLCEPDNLWRGNDVTRGVWADDADGHGVCDEFDLDGFDLDDEQIMDLARARIRQLVAA